MSRITRILKICVYSTLGGIFLFLALTNQYDAFYSSIGLNGIVFKVLRVIIFGILCAFFLNRMQDQFPNKF